MKTILVFNGSPNGSTGNCQELIKIIRPLVETSYKVEVIQLAKLKSYKALFKKIKKASGFLFVTGTYWDSWGSPLQKLLESLTELEGSQDIIGKPCAVFVLMHSVGGKGVLSRLQGVLSTMGFLIPPMSGMVYSVVTDLALKGKKSLHHDDFWSLQDVPLVIKNFLLSLQIQVPWIVWPVDRKNFRKKWLR